MCLCQLSHGGKSHLIDEDMAWDSQAVVARGMLAPRVSRRRRLGDGWGRGDDRRVGSGALYFSWRMLRRIAGSKSVHASSLWKGLKVSYV